MILSWLTMSFPYFFRLRLVFANIGSLKSRRGRRDVGWRLLHLCIHRQKDLGDIVAENYRHNQVPLRYSPSFLLSAGATRIDVRHFHAEPRDFRFKFRRHFRSRRNFVLVGVKDSVVGRNAPHRHFWRCFGVAASQLCLLIPALPISLSRIRHGYGVGRNNGSSRNDFNERATGLHHGS